MPVAGGGGCTTRGVCACAASSAGVGPTRRCGLLAGADACDSLLAIKDHGSLVLPPDVSSIAGASLFDWVEPIPAPRRRPATTRAAARIGGSTVEKDVPYPSPLAHVRLWRLGRYGAVYTPGGYFDRLRGTGGGGRCRFELTTQHVPLRFNHRP